MIKAVVLDIDGVIVGTKKGINFPHPSRIVCKALLNIHNNGVPVVFITAKASFAASRNIKYVGLDNAHIANAGAVLFNPMQEKIFHAKPIPARDIFNVLSAIPDDKFVNLFSVENYFILKKVKEKFTGFVAKYGEFMEQLPITLENFDEVIRKETIVKINIVAFDEVGKNEITKMANESVRQFIYKWSTTPFIAPAQVMVVTASGVSKRSGVEILTRDLKVSLGDVLGVGDTIQDWDFMEVCGYKATLTNGSKELKNKLDFSDKKQFMGGHVDDDGILDILKHFKLI